MAIEPCQFCEVYTDGTVYSGPCCSRCYTPFMAGYQAALYPHRSPVPVTVSVGPKLSIEFADHANSGSDQCYFTRVLLDGESIGFVQRIRYTDRMGTPLPMIEIDQIVYTDAGFKHVEALRRIPGLVYTPTFMNAGPREEWHEVEEKDFIPTPEADF